VAGGDDRRSTMSNHMEINVTKKPATPFERLIELNTASWEDDEPVDLRTSSQQQRWDPNRSGGRVHWAYNRMMVRSVGALVAHRGRVFPALEIAKVICVHVGLDLTNRRVEKRRPEQILIDFGLTELEVGSLIAHEDCQKIIRAAQESIFEQPIDGNQPKPHAYRYRKQKVAEMLQVTPAELDRIPFLRPHTKEEKRKRDREAKCRKRRKSGAKSRAEIAQVTLAKYETVSKIVSSGLKGTAAAQEMTHYLRQTDPNCKPLTAKVFRRMVEEAKKRGLIRRVTAPKSCRRK
jgi:hypothetical protein